MKQKEIRKNTDYIIGSERNIWDGVEYAVRNGKADTYVPYRCSRIRVIDDRLYSQSSGSFHHRGEPSLIPEGTKPNRSYNNVGALAVVVKPNQELSDPFVVRPQEVRMEFDAWRTEYVRRAHLADERRKRAAEERAEKERAAKIAEADREGRAAQLNEILKGSGVTAKVVFNNEVVLTGAHADLLDLARAGAKVGVR